MLDFFSRVKEKEKKKEINLNNSSSINFKAVIGNR